MSAAGAGVGALAAWYFASASKYETRPRRLPVLLEVSHAQAKDKGPKYSDGTPSASAPFSHELSLDETLEKGLPAPDSSWDSNWDKRDPEFIRAHRRAYGKDTDDDGSGPPRPTASRRLILIRHGQYNLSGVGDRERMLTELGHRQAEETAARLRYILAKTPPTQLVHSTMTRAIQTFKSIQDSFPNTEVSSSDLLREGPPYPPDPPSKTYRPEYHVSLVMCVAPVFSSQCD